MTLPVSGSISFSQLRTEFTGITLTKLSDYYRNGAYVTSGAVAPDVPTSGTISVSNFYGATGAVGTYLPANTLWAWGRDDDGQNGISPTGGITYWVPTQSGYASNYTNWRYVSSGVTTTMAIKHDGTLWATGRNDLNASLGLGALGASLASIQTFLQVGSSTNWARVSVRRGNNYDTHVVAIKTDGTLWAWGNNANGQLGLGDTVKRTSPTQVGALTTWSKVVAGGLMTIAIKTDGTLWSWGSNSNGELGQGDFTLRTTPTQIGTGTTWKEISSNDHYSIALKTDGTLWGWGFNDWGQLSGLAYYSNILTPTQIGTATWKAIVAGYQSITLIKSDGTMWACGWNQLGQLGFGNTTSVISPMLQVGTDTDWKSVESSYATVYAKKNDGSLWVSGWGSLGQLGLGNTVTTLSVFTKLGTTINWNQVAVNARGALATVLPDFSQNTITSGDAGNYRGWFGPNYPYGNIGSATTSPWYINGLQVLQVAEIINTNQFAVCIDGYQTHLDVDLKVDNVSYYYTVGAIQGYVQPPPYAPGHPNGITMFYFTIPTGSPYFVPSNSYDIKIRIYQSS